MSEEATELTPITTPDPLKDRLERHKKQVLQENGLKSVTQRTLEFHNEQRELEKQREAEEQRKAEEAWHLEHAVD